MLKTFIELLTTVQVSLNQVQEEKVSCYQVIYIVIIIGFDGPLIWT